MIRIITNGKENGKRAYLAQMKWSEKLRRRPLKSSALSLKTPCSSSITVAARTARP